MKKKPLVTFILFTYNQDQYIREAVEGAISQTYEPLEIIISDDCSSDNTYYEIEKIIEKYKGPHKILLNRNKINLGLIEHVNHVCMNIATTDILVFGAGDDISLPNRVEKTVEAMIEDKEIKSFSMRYNTISSKGDILQTISRKYQDKRLSLDDFLKGSHIYSSGCSRAYHIDLFKVFGPLNKNCGVEDAALVFRALLLGVSVDSSEVGVLYRRLPNTLSNNISFEKMEGKIAQRLIDARLAYDLKIADYPLIEYLIKDQKIATRKHALYQRVFNGKCSLKCFVSSIIFNRDFNSAEKINLMKTIIKSRIQLYTQNTNR